MSKQNYLTTKNGTFYFRIAVPKYLRSKIHKSELIYSLRTKCKYEAKARCLNMLRASQLLFKRFEDMPRLTQEKAKEIVKQYFSEAMQCLEHQMDVVDEYSGLLATISKTPSPFDLTSDRKRLDFLYPDTFYDNKNSPNVGLEEHCTQDTSRVISLIANKHNIDATEGTYSFEVLKTAAQRAIIELLNVHRQYVNYDTDIKISDEIFQDATTNLKLIEDNNPPISEIFEKYLAECKRNDEGQHSLDGKRSCYALWIEVFEDHSINTLTPEKAKQFKETLLKLPKNKSKVYPDKTIKELMIISVPNDQRMSTSTINGYLMHLSIFSQWAIDNHHLNLSKNPFEGLRLKRKKKAIEARNPFSTKQLQAMFSTPFYKGCKNDTKHSRFVTGNLIIKDHYYWIPLLALYTGARLSEILQLATQDIKQKQDVWFFDINDEDDGKNLKTTQSKRCIPIHTALLKAGLMDYVSEIRKENKSRLFYQIEPYKGDYSHRYSKWFSRYLKRYKIKTDKTSFHSFRHNFRDGLKGKVNETLLRALLGHEKGDAHSAYGSSNYDLKDLKSAIDKLDYSMLDLNMSIKPI